MQTISTKFFGPTNSRGSRIKATTSGGAGTVTLSYDHALNAEANHTLAAVTLINKLGWYKDSEPGADYGKWYMGEGVDGKGYVYVCAVPYAEVDMSTKRSSK